MGRQGHRTRHYIISATLQLTNTALAARTTNEDDLETFAGVDMPDLLNVTITADDLGTFEFTDQSITDGTNNLLELSVG